MCEGSTAPAANQVCADFSYQCKPYAGSGYFLIGDAATFIDPIFSTGVCLGMMSGVKAADAALAILKERGDASSLRKEYCKYVEGSSAVFFRLVRGYYRHGFREMFLAGQGPLNVHNAVLSALAGHVFPAPVFATRWRLSLFFLMLAIHERRGLAAPRAKFVLRDSAPVPQTWAQVAPLATAAPEMVEAA